MKNKWLQKVLAVILGTALLLGMGPNFGGNMSQVQARNTSEVTVGGVKFGAAPDCYRYATTDGAGVVTTDYASESNYNVMFENGVLTLRDAEIIYNSHSSNDCAIAADHGGDLEIKLEGSNTVEINGTDTGSKCIDGISIGTGNLTITGSGTLTSKGGNDVYTSRGIAVDGGNLTIDGAVVIARGRDADGSSGIYVSGNITIKNKAKVIATAGHATNGNSCGIEGGIEGTITVESGTVEAISKATGKEDDKGNSYGIFVQEGKSITIKGGKVTAKSGTVSLGKISQALSISPTLNANDVSLKEGNPTSTYVRYEGPSDTFAPEIIASTKGEKNNYSESPYQKAHSKVSNALALVKKGETATVDQTGFYSYKVCMLTEIVQTQKTLITTYIDRNGARQSCVLTPELAAKLLEDGSAYYGFDYILKCSKECNR